jgi:hypothetical protein
MYVCMYVYAHMCVCVCIYIYMYVCMYVCMYKLTCVRDRQDCSATCRLSSIADWRALSCICSSASSSRSRTLTACGVKRPKCKRLVCSTCVCVCALIAFDMRDDTLTDKYNGGAFIFGMRYDLPRVELSFSCAHRRSTHAPVHPIRTATLQLWFGELGWPLRRPVVHQTHAVFSFQNVFRNSSSISVASDGMQMGHGSHEHHRVHSIRRSNGDWNEKMEERGELVALVSLVTIRIMDGRTCNAVTSFNSFSPSCSPPFPEESMPRIPLLGGITRGIRAIDAARISFFSIAS